MDIRLGAILDEAMIGYADKTASDVCCVEVVHTMIVVGGSHVVESCSE